MKLYVEKASLETMRVVYENFMQEDFPPDEIKPFAVIEKMFRQDSYIAYGFYEKDADGKRLLRAYAFLLADNKNHVLLLDYFAVCKEKRGSGYGSCALTLLREVCAAWKEILIEVEDDEREEIDEETRQARRRRISFYTGAGCRMTTVRTCLWGVYYRIMTLPLKETAGMAKEEAAKERVVNKTVVKGTEEKKERTGEELRALYEGMYDETTLRKYFEILSF